ncbi:DUF4129 domain-containing protein [Acanthopleuribacter pedis]|uniref:DUF4129 domain-containing protein n=1 Tax=Acanthopleuribacter pedis TaxID=442870 RepID=A0A8J7U5A3_9BACT|nr:DUF4129 domain-containing protein [Acanthopleuribacter pedis]MBO1320248.1 DUF4129 domain-containing protein [Acanthopleuribacter pedis]
MNLDQLSLAVRPRDTWTAVDLGLLLSRSWRGSYFAPWLISVVTVWLVVNVLFWQYPILATLVFWWFKPAFDRLLLWVFSRVTFGVQPGTRETLATWRTYFRSPWFRALTWQRLSPMRVVHLAVSELEQSTGDKRKKRTNALGATLFSPLLLTTFAFFFVELFVLLPSLFLFSHVMMPFGLAEHVFSVMNADQAIQTLNLAQLLIVLFLEPYYVGACFSLYLNTRTILEGWDLRITFKKLAARLQQLTPLLLFVLLCPPGWSAQPEPDTAAEPTELTQTREEIQTLLDNHEDFNKQETKGRWVYRFDHDGPEVGDIPPTNFSALTGLGRFFVNLFIILFIVLVIVAVILFLRWSAGRRIAGVATLKPETVNPREAAKSGLIIDPESLPDQLLEAAQAAWRKGSHRIALSYLFRGAIARMMDADLVAIEEYATEGEVLAQVKKQAPQEMAEDFKKLTQTWITLAYGHQVPDEARFYALCTAFRRHWHQEAK